MKEQAISRINKVGKVCTVVALICRILVIVGLSAVVIGTVACFVLPNDLINVELSGEINADVNYDSLGIDIPEDKLEKAEAFIRDKEQGTHRRGDDYLTTSNGQLYMAEEIIAEDGTVSVKLSSDVISFDLRKVAEMLLVVTIALVMTLVTLFFISALCKAFRDCKSPFEENVIKKMQNLAIVLIPWTIVSSLTGSIRAAFMTNNFRWSVGVDLGVVFVVLIVLVLAYIFKYGAMLQQESDETL